MSDNKLKIDVVLADVGESGAVLSDFVTQELHNTDLAKKADLVNGKVNPTQLPEFSELSGVTDVFSQLEINLRENINTSLAESKAYADSIVSVVMSKKADLVNGRVPKEQATNFADIPGAKAAIDGLKQSLGQEIIGINNSLENNFAKLTNGKVSQTVLPTDLVYSDHLTREMNDVRSALQNTMTQVGEELTVLETETNNKFISKIEAEYFTKDIELKAAIDGLEQKSYTSYASKIVETTKADLTYVNRALGALSTDATKFYPTLALANADIANLQVNQPVQVGEVENGGLYYKPTAVATTLTKSAYDPLNQSKDFFYEETGLYSTKNIVDPDQTVANGYFAGTGTTGAGSNYYYGTEYYAVSAGTKLWMKGVDGGQVIQFCDENKNPLWFGSSTSIVGGIFTVPATAGSPAKPISYIRIGTNKGANAFADGLVQMGYGDVLPSRSLTYQEEYLEFKSDDFINPIIEQSVELSKALVADKIVEFENLIDPNQETTQGFFGGTTITGTGNPAYLNFYICNDYYPATVGTKLWMKGVTGGQVIQFYRANHSAIWNASSSSIVDGIYTVPATIGAVNLSDTAFIRVATSLGEDAIRDGRVAIGYGDVAPIGLPVYNTYYAEVNEGLLTGIKGQLAASDSPLKDKKWLALGDSITNNPNCYAKVLADKYGATLTKHSQDGAWIHNGAESIPRVLSESYVNIGTSVQYDLITIAAGTNDGVVTLGTLDDRVTTTLYGALHVLLSGLRSMFPKARIAFISQIPRSSLRSNPVTPTALDIKVKAIKEVCAYYSVPLWVGHENFGWHPDDNATTKTDLMPDGLHPNVDGHVWYANRVEAFILSLAK